VRLCTAGTESLHPLRRREMLACRELLILPAGRGGGSQEGWSATSPPPHAMSDGRETLSLSLSHFYILKSGYTLLNLEEALFHWERHFPFTKTQAECTYLSYMATKFLLLFLEKCNALLLFHFYTKIYEILCQSFVALYWSGVTKLFFFKVGITVYFPNKISSFMDC
jgi:hypothetical protein